MRLLAATALACATLPVLAGPAQAVCVRDWEEEIAKGGAVAIVTRIDDARDRLATFRVERSFGIDLPPTVTGRTTGGMDDSPHVYSQELTALVFQRDGGWILRCERDLGEVLERADGPPKAVSNEPPVAVAAGLFGGSNLVTLDRFGRPVAWSRKTYAWPGWTALCPDGRRVVTQEWAQNNEQILAVYDTTDLRLVRADRLLGWGGRTTSAITCTDPRAETVVLDADVSDPSSAEAKRIRVTLRHGAVVREESPRVEKSYDPDSYRLLEGGRVVEIPKGSPRLKAPSAEGNGVSEVIAAPGGVIAAAWTAGTYDDTKYEYRGDGQILILDQKTQRVLARWKPGAIVNQLAWTASGTLIARLGYRAGDYSDTYRQGEIVRLDRELHVLSRGPGIPGWHMTVVGESAVFSGSAPMRVSTASGRTVDFADQRLAAAGLVIPLGSEGFVDEAPPTKSLAIRSGGDSTDRTAVGILVGLAVAMGIAATGAVWRRAP